MLWDAGAHGTKPDQQCPGDLFVLGLNQMPATVVTDPGFYRPAELQLSVGNPAKAQAKLGWRPKTQFEGLVFEMVTADCENLGIDVPATRSIEVK